ncbi:AMIN domain-containing protein [Chrysosporum bergii ANA360D]|jgi:hypothetical protein|uniref:AMIN domain-containing protein n=1 Tax=Chrysosporum bergii ANA360D TaxID=617107 RepID=A0AA43GPV2_9CYAN|nr:AMIN domain-containing protein [Chrysosporum bergii]MDH6059275.1 AMIN domain-containing protein [Chrysosporum bergii ANA360D]
MIKQFWQCTQGLLGLYAVTFLQTGSSFAAPVARLDNWRFYPEAVELEINLSASTTPKYFYLAEPPRLVVDLPNTKLGYVSTIQNYWGAVKRIRVSQLHENVTRIVLDLASANSVDPRRIQLQPNSPQNPTRWVLRPTITNYTPSPPPVNLQSLPNLSPSLYPVTPNPRQPFVTVPPLQPRNSSQLPPSTLPPASFPARTNPNPSVPIIPNYQPSVPNIQVIEFGQPLPNPITKYPLN